MSKVELHIAVDAELLARANEKGVRLDTVLEDGIRAALSRPDMSSERDAAAQTWAEENAEAIASHRKFIKEFGAFGDDLRTW